MSEGITGGCQCGRIRYALDQAPEAEFCHCGMCRKATGGAFGALASIPLAHVRWTTRPPDLFRSSTTATRGFCSACGTPLTFAYDGGQTLDLSVGSLDDPSIAGPVRMEFAVEYRLPWVTEVAGAKQQRLDAYRGSPVHKPGYQSFQAGAE